ncbi:MAG TPA: thioredoxin [Tepidisphaeraceae bacterium]|jgi:thioredoxin
MRIVVCPKCGAKNRVDENRESHVATRAICGRCKAELPDPGGDAGGQDGPIGVTDQSIDSLLASAGDRPVLLDCWAAWCGPCRMIAPAIDQIAAASAGRYVVGKLNTDENPKTATQFQIDALPTLLIFKKGELVDRMVGAYPRHEIEDRLVKQI